MEYKIRWFYRKNSLLKKSVDPGDPMCSVAAVDNNAVFYWALDICRVSGS